MGRSKRIIRKREVKQSEVVERAAKSKLVRAAIQSATYEKRLYKSAKQTETKNNFRCCQTFENVEKVSLSKLVVLLRPAGQAYISKTEILKGRN